MTRNLTFKRQHRVAHQMSLLPGQIWFKLNTLRFWLDAVVHEALLLPRLVRGFFSTSGICSMMISDLGLDGSSPQ